MPENKPEPIFSSKLETKGNNYFFDVRVAKNSNKYLSISETWVKEGKPFRSTITVFGNNFDEFCRALGEIQDKLK